MERGRFELIHRCTNQWLLGLIVKVSDKCLTIKCHKSVVNIRFFSEMAGFESIRVLYKSSIGSF